MTLKNNIALFEWQSVRKIRYNEERYFVLEDVILILTDSLDVRQYIKKLKKRDSMLDSNWGTICTPLQTIAKDGKKRKMLCSNTTSILRIIQSIPSSKAEPFKQRLATLWHERIQEINDPELSMQRMIETYEKKWYPKEWIDIRTRWIPVRKWLTKERDERWWDKAYGILTNEIYKAYSGMDNQQWMQYKNIQSGNLRDGMNPTELILTMLAEQATTDITRSRNAQWLSSLKQASKDGGWVAFKARKELQEQTGKDPITNENYIAELKQINTSKKIITEFGGHEE